MIIIVIIIIMDAILYGINELIKQNLNSNQVNQTNQTSQTNQKQLAETLTNNFLGDYYSNISYNGWNSVGYLFDHSCGTIIKDKPIGNYHNLLEILSANYIKKANYANLSIKWSLQTDCIIINVFGIIQFVSFMNVNSNISSFSETFIIKQFPDNKFRCTAHMFDFL
jgi:hypothetical protein